MSIRRFDHGPRWMEECDDGLYVLNADHADDVAALTERAERAEKENAEMRAALEQSERQLAASRAIARRESIGCDAWSERAVKAEKANALLRAECEAWRDQARIEGDGCTALMSEDEASKWGSAVIQAYNKLIDARAATDAAGALKGVE